MTNKVNHSEFVADYLQQYPEEVASIIEQIAPEEIAQFITEQEADNLARLFTCLLPQYAAKILRHIPDEQQQEILQCLDIDTVIKILRTVQGDNLNTLLKHLPPKQLTLCQRSLNYDASMVGYWMKRLELVLSANYQVQAALQYLTQQEGQVTEPLYAVDRDGQLVGKIAYSKLLKAKPEEALSAVLQKSSKGVSARTSLASIENAPLWSQDDVVPVLDRNNKLIGVLSYKRLKLGLSHKSQTQNTELLTTALSNAMKAYGQLLSSFTSNIASVKIQNNS